MGKRKRESANLMKDARKNEAFAKLRNCPSSPRKMRLVVDMVRGVEVFKALGPLLKQSSCCRRRETPQIGHFKLGTEEWCQG